MSYDDIYTSNKNYFGEEPESILRRYYNEIDKSKPVLDIGAGQGRNTFFLARKGYVVDAIDSSKVGTEIISTTAIHDKLHIHAYQSDFKEFTPKTDFYSGILIFGLIQVLSWDNIVLLREKVKKWTQKGSILFITGFTTADAFFIQYSQTWKVIGKNSFADKQKNIHTYLETGEILDLFNNYEVIYHWEGMGPEHKHGNNPIERHAIFKVVLRRN